MVTMATKPQEYILVVRDISLWLGIYYDISLTTGLYEKYIPVDFL